MTINGRGVKIEAIILADPAGEWTDEALAARFDVSQQAVTALRRRRGLPSALERRRTHSPPRFVRIGACERTGRRYRLPDGAQSIRCRAPECRDRPHRVEASGVDLGEGFKVAERP